VARVVLVVDDNPALVDNLREILEDAGYGVHGAGSCADALARAKEGFDVALVDVRLPDGDGTLLAPKLRELQPDGQVILLTGFATVESAVAAVRAGAWAYLLKPCATPDLLLAIEQATRQIALREEKRQLETRTRVAEKLAAIGTLTAGLSHEIKNPLNAAGLQLTVLERRIKKLSPETQEQLQGPLHLVRDEVARLNRILEEFLQFARPRELERQPIDLGALTNHVIDLLAPQAESAQVKLERAIGTLPELKGDAARLQQVVMNLVLNAIQATPPGGHVAVEAAVHDAQVILSVDDSGPGVPASMRSRIFEPFFTTKSGGSGLGLPLVHAIVEQHGGTIAFERSPFGGARFLVRLPR
jgi:signal transduction histidine kinase